MAKRKESKPKVISKEVEKNYTSMSSAELTREILSVIDHLNSERITLEYSNQLSEKIYIELDRYTKVEVFITTHSPPGEPDGKSHPPMGRKKLLNILKS